ncbi:hypothetical protein D3C77_514950 [compost metagenome]
MSCFVKTRNETRSEPSPQTASTASEKPSVIPSIGAGVPARYCVNPKLTMNKYFALVHAEAKFVRILPAINAAIIMTILAAVLRTSTDTINASIATTELTNQMSPICINIYFH